MSTHNTDFLQALEREQARLTERRVAMMGDRPAYDDALWVAVAIQDKIKALRAAITKQAVTDEVKRLRADLRD